MAVESSEIIKDFVGYTIPSLIRNGWHLKFAKGGPKDPEHPEQSLFTHSINGIFGLGRLLTFLEKEKIEIRGLDEEILKKTLSLYILHDLHKVLEKEGKSQFSIPLEKIEEEYKKLGLDKIVELDAHLIRAANVHSRSSKQGDILLSSEDNGSLEWLLVRIADSMASMVSQREYSTLWNYLKRLSSKIPENYALYYHEVKEIRGVLTNLIHTLLVNILDKYRLFPLLFFPNGVIYIGQSNFSKNNEEILSELCTNLIKTLPRYGKLEQKTMAEEGRRKEQYDFQSYVYSFADMETLLEVVEERIKSDDKLPSKELDKMLEKRKDLSKWVGEFSNRFYISSKESKYFNEIWSLIYKYLLYVDAIIRDLLPDNDRLEWFIKNFHINKLIAQNLKEDKDIFLKGGYGKYVLVIAYHFLKGPDFYKRAAEEMPKEEIIQILYSRVINRLKNSDLNAGRIRLLENLGYDSDFPDYLREQVYFSFSPKVVLQQDALSGYTEAKSKSYPSKFCSICNRKSDYMQEARAGILGDYVQGFSNRVLPVKKQGGIIKWCPICSFEFTLRKLVGLSMKGDYKASHRINFYILPTYSFTPDHSLIFDRILTPIRKMTSLKIRGSEDDWGFPRIWLERKGFDIDLEERLIDALEKEAMRIRDKDWGERIYTSQISLEPNYFLIVWERALPSNADKENIPTRTEVWAKALFGAGILTTLTGAKVLVTEKPFVEFLNPNSFIPTIILDSPHSMLKTVIGDKDGVSLENLESVLDLSSALWIINSLMRDGRKDKHISELLELISTNPLAGAIFYKAHAREQAKKPKWDEPPGHFTKACSILLNYFGGDTMDLAKEIAEKSLEIALPFRGSGRGKFHRFELIFREAVKAIREAMKAIPDVKTLISSGKQIPEEKLTEVKTLAIGTLKKAMERRQQTRRGEIIVNPRFKSEGEFRVDIEQMISLVVDELFVKRARGGFAKFIDLENSVADGIYYVIDKQLPQEWNKRKAIKSFKEGELSVSEAAQLAGMDKVSFMEELGKQGVSVFNYPPEELEEDLRSIEKAGETR